METQVKDVQTGRSLFYIDGDELRDANGKIVGGRVSRKRETLTLAATASRLMRGEPVESNEHGRLMADLAPGDVASPTAARAAYVPVPSQEFVADDVAPVSYVAHDRGNWWLENPADAIQAVVATGVGSGAAPSELSPTFTKTPFVLIGYGLACRLPILGAGGNADFDVKLVALRRIVGALRLAREARVAAMILNASNWAANNQVPVIAKWNGGATANPLADLYAARATGALAPTTLVMTEAAEQHFFANANSTRVRDFGQAGGQLPRILVGRARQMVAGVPSYVWGNAAPVNAALVREVTDTDTEIGTARTLRWLGEGAPDGEVKDGLLVRIYEYDHADFVVVVHNDLEIMLQSPSTIGALLTGALQ